MDTKQWFERMVTSVKEDPYYHCYKHTIAVEGQDVEVDFHYVGRNASHEFSVGMLIDSRLVMRTFGEEGYEEVEFLGAEYLEPIVKEVIKIFEIDQLPSYLGH